MQKYLVVESAKMLGKHMYEGQVFETDKDMSEYLSLGFVKPTDQELVMVPPPAKEVELELEPTPAAAGEVIPAKEMTKAEKKAAEKAAKEAEKANK